MLVDVNELLLAEQKKLKYLAFSIKPKNKHNLKFIAFIKESPQGVITEEVSQKHEYKLPQNALDIPRQVYSLNTTEITN